MMDVGATSPQGVVGVVGGADGKQEIPKDEPHPCK